MAPLVRCERPADPSERRRRHEDTNAAIRLAGTAAFVRPSGEFTEAHSVPTVVVVDVLASRRRWLVSLSGALAQPVKSSG
jgi:hypothetical protein